MASEDSEQQTFRMLTDNFYTAIVAGAALYTLAKRARIKNHALAEGYDVE